jgi:hypothetical protein
MASVRVPLSQSAGSVKIAVEFDSGPLAGTLRTEKTMQVGGP